MRNPFPTDFAWGAASSAYQIEGAATDGGRQPSVWDRFCDWPGKVAMGQSGAVACDHYHRMREDVALMRELGLKAYRFSFSWSRLLPDGIGKRNCDGFDFYERLIDELLVAGIEPWATLFHWDYPVALYNRGGWLNPDSPAWFEEYTRVVAERFSGQINNWMTFNEPQCFIGLGHGTGVHAPGLKLSNRDLLEIQRNFLLAHGRSAQVLRTHGGPTTRIGIAPVSSVPVPATNSAEDIEAARRAGFEAIDPGQGLWPQQFCLDPIIRGEWPEEASRRLCPEFAGLGAADLAAISQPIDFIGLNYYQAVVARMSPAGDPEVVPHAIGHPRTAFDWPVLPEGLYWQIRFHAERYDLPCAITENGLSGLDWVSEDGAVHDPQRIDYILRHVRWMAKAMEEGYEVLGYFHWALLDNFEWAEGYRHRFGLIHVDYETLQRTPKDSAYWYRDLIRTNGAVLFDRFSFA